MQIAQKVIEDSKSLRKKIKLFYSSNVADRESVNAITAEFQFVCEVLKATEFDEERAGRILKNHSPFKRGREQKLLRDDYIDRTISAALDSVKSNSNREVDSPFAECTPATPGPTRVDLAKSPKKNRASRRKWLKEQQSPIPFDNWSEESLAKLPSSTKRLFELTSSSQKEYQRPDLIQFCNEENCCSKFTTVQVDTLARLHVTVDVSKDSDANVNFRHFWCGKASCKCCAHGVRSEASDLAAIRFPQWSEQFFVYELSDWSGVRASLNRTVGGKYVRVAIDADRWLLFSPKPVNHDSLKLVGEMKVRDAILLFAEKVWSIPVGRWKGGKKVEGKLAIGGKEWDFGHVLEGAQCLPSGRIFSETWTDVSITALKMAISELNLNPEQMIGLQARSGNFFSAIQVLVPVSIAASDEAKIELVQKIHVRAVEIINTYQDEFLKELIENFRPSKATT